MEGGYTPRSASMDALAMFPGGAEEAPYAGSCPTTAKAVQGTEDSNRCGAVYARRVFAGLQDG